ncbi:MAG: carbohydrate kinase family protein [Eubacteriales bacterium]|nr:carbohydrate kinase family protein [Eubacteriales bacterium]
MHYGVDIVVLGYIFNEHIMDKDGHISGPFLGATAAYGSMALGRAGFSTGLVSNVGPDTPFSLIEPFIKANVDLEGLNKYPDSCETKDILKYFDDGTKIIEYETRAPIIMPNDIPNKYLDTMKVMMLCLVDYEVDIKTIEHVRHKRKDVLVSADLGGIGGAHSTKELRNQYIYLNGGQLQKKVLSLIDIGKMSSEDYACISGKKSFTLKDAAQDLLDQGLSIVVITLGEDGCYIRTKDGQEFKTPAVTPINGVVDTTGAGDTFIVIFTAEYVRTGDIEKSALFASATSSILIEKTGGVSVERCPDRAMIEERLKSFLI